MRGRRAIAAWLGILAVAGAAWLTGDAGPDRPLSWVALGESVAAGAGTGVGFDVCGRQRGAYARQAAARLDHAGRRIDLAFLPCSGDHLEDIRSRQVPAVTDTTDVVTVTFGGNDVGYVAELVHALRASAGVTVTAPTTDTPVAVDPVDWDGLTTTMGEVLRTIRSRMAPDGFVYVVSYPHLFAPASSWSGGRCFGFDPAEAHRLDAGVDRLNRAITRAAARADAAAGNVRLVTWPDGPGALCGDGEPTTSGYRLPVPLPSGRLGPSGSFHPTRAGHELVATVLVEAITSDLAR